MYLHSSLSFHVLDDMPDNDVNIAFREAAIIDTNSGPNIERRDKGKTYSLPSEQQTQLMALYQAKYARFASLVALYEAEKHRARHARKLSAFPPMSSWQPQSRHLSPEEATMMQGGDECVIKYQFVHVMTKGIIRGAELEAERREGSSTKSSLVFFEGRSRHHTIIWKSAILLPALLCWPTTPLCCCRPLWKTSARCKNQLVVCPIHSCCWKKCCGN